MMLVRTNKCTEMTGEKKRAHATSKISRSSDLTNSIYSTWSSWFDGIAREKLHQFVMDCHRVNGTSGWDKIGK